MVHSILYKDKAGNTARLEGKSLAVRNRKGQLVTKKATFGFLKAHENQIEPKLERSLFHGNTKHPSKKKSVIRRIGEVELNPNWLV